MEKQWKLYFWGLQITEDGDCSHEIKRCLLLGRKVMANLDSILKSRDYFVNKAPSSQGYGFFSSHVWMWELDYKESWAPKYWCFWTVVLEKTLESPLDCKIKLVKIVAGLSIEMMFKIDFLEMHFQLGIHHGCLQSCLWNVHIPSKCRSYIKVILVLTN